MAPALGALPYSMVSPKLHQPGLWRGPGNTRASSPGTGDTFLLSLSGLALMTLPISVSSVSPLVEEHPWHPWDVLPPLADFTSSIPILCSIPDTGRRRKAPVPRGAEGQVT